MGIDNISELKKELEDIKALLILSAQANFDNETIGRALGLSPGRVSQLVDKVKYPRK